MRREHEDVRLWSGIYDFDNDGGKTCYHPGTCACMGPGKHDQRSRTRGFESGASGNGGSTPKQVSQTRPSTASRLRFGDFDGDGRHRRVTTGLDMMPNCDEPQSSFGTLARYRLRGLKRQSRRHRGASQGVTKAGAQYNHQTSSVCYAILEPGAGTFRAGRGDQRITVEIRWPRASCRLWRT